MLFVFRLLSSFVWFRLSFGFSSRVSSAAASSDSASLRFGLWTRRSAAGLHNVAFRALKSGDAEAGRAAEPDARGARNTVPIP